MYTDFLTHLIKEAGLEKDSYVRAMAQAISWTDSKRSSRLADRLSWYVKIKMAKRGQVIDRHPFYPFPEKEELDQGEIVVGLVPPNDRDEDFSVFSLAKEVLTMGTLIVGKPGAGKTNLLCSLDHQLLEEDDIKIILFDFKRSARDYILPAVGFNPNKAIVVTIGETPRIINVLRAPSSVKRKPWLNAFYDTFEYAYEFKPGSTGFLIEHINKLYDLYDVYSPGDCPCIADVYDYLNMVTTPRSGPNRDYSERCRNRLRSMLDTFGSPIETSEGYFEKLLTSENPKMLILEFEGQNVNEEAFLVGMLLCYIYFLALYHDQKRTSIKLLLCFDDCPRLFNARHYAGFSNIADIVARLRAFGIGICISSQCPHMLDSAVVANLNTRICFHVGGRDAQQVAMDMGLDEEQMLYLMKMPTGEAVVQTGTLPAFTVNAPPSN